MVLTSLILRNKRASELGISYDGPYIAAYQWQTGNVGTITGPFGDNSAHPSGCAGYYYLGRGFSFHCLEENANNAVLGFYNGSPQYMVQRQYFKPIRRFLELKRREVAHPFLQNRAAFRCAER